MEVEVCVQARANFVYYQPNTSVERCTVRDVTAKETLLYPLNKRLPFDTGCMCAGKVQTHLATGTPYEDGSLTSTPHLQYRCLYFGTINYS
jgi:hypothetical protein